MADGNAAISKAFYALKRALRDNPSWTREFLSLTRTKDSKEEINGFSTVVEIDEDWLEMVEKKLPFLIAAVAEERQFVRTEGDIMPIERVRAVSKDSIVDLSKHSSYVTRMPDPVTGIVIPDKLYVAKKENDYSVYENRFLYTALCYISDFMELRLNQILAISGRYEAESIYEKHIQMGSNTLDFTMTLKENRENDPLAQSQGDSGNAVARLTDSLGTIRMLLATPLMKTVSKSPMVRVPVTKTNVIRFDTNFRETLELFEYLHSYSKPGFTTHEERIHLCPFLDQRAKEDFGLILFLTSFITYEYATTLEKAIEQIEAAEDERLAEEAKKALFQSIEKAKRDVAEKRMSPEEYIALLEEGKVAFEKMVASQEDQIFALRTSQDERFRKASKRFDGDMIAYRSYCDQIVAEEVLRIQQSNEDEEKRLAALEEQILEKMKATEESAASAIAMKEAVVEEKEARISELQAAVAERDSALAEANDRILELEGLMKSLRLQLNLPEEEDYSSEEAFDELERRKVAFDRYFEKTWKGTRKALIKRMFAAPDPKAKKKGGKGR